MRVVARQGFYCNTLYADICTALLRASTGCIEKGRDNNNEHMVPGWNDSVLTCTQKPAMRMYYGTTLVSLGLARSVNS